MKHVLKRVRCAWAVLPAAMFLGCAPTPEPTAEPLTLRETFDHLRLCYKRHAYLAMEPYLDPMHADQVVDLLVAVDEMMAANAGAIQAVKQVCPGMSVDRFDLTGITNCLDLFAQRLEFAGQQESGNMGIIRAHVGGKLCELRFRKEGGYWLYEPDPSTTKLLPVFRELAKSLHHIRAVAPARKSPDDICDEFRIRVDPKIKRITQITPTSQPA